MLSDALLGPLTSRDKHGERYAVGVVSIGYGCGMTDYPGLYTRIADFLPWIKANMYKLSNNCK